MKSIHSMASWCICAALATACGCKTSAAEPPSGEYAAQDATPGSIIPITLDLALPPGAKPPQVRIGNEVAPVQKVVRSNVVNVLVPLLPPGPATVSVRTPGGETVTNVARIVIARAPSQQLVLSLKGTNLTLLSATPRAEPPSSRADPSQPRISYDVISKRGDLVTSGSIVHPTKGRNEVFDAPQAGTIRLAPMRYEAVFLIKVPNVPGGATVRFYEAAGGIDLATGEGRSQRQLINEITFQ